VLAVSWYGVCVVDGGLADNGVGAAIEWCEPGILEALVDEEFILVIDAHIVGVVVGVAHYPSHNGKADNDHTDNNDGEFLPLLTFFPLALILLALHLLILLLFFGKRLVTRCHVT